MSDQAITVNLSEADLERIDAWRNEIEPVSSREEAVEQLVAMGLDDAEMKGPVLGPETYGEVVPLIAKTLTAINLLRAGFFEKEGVDPRSFLDAVSDDVCALAGLLHISGDDLQVETTKIDMQLGLKRQTQA